MRFQTTQELLEKVKQFHIMASDYYLDLTREIERHRVGMLLDYLRKHETKLAEHISRIQENATPTLLKTWFDDAPDINLDKALENLQLQQPLDVDDVIQVGMHIGDYLIWAYENLAQQAETAEVRNTFENLAEMARSDKRQLSLDSQGMQDM